MTDKNADLSELAKFMRAWAEDKTAFKKKSLVTLKEEAERLEELLCKPYASHRVKEGMKILQEYLDRIEIIEEKIIKEAKGDCPYAFAKPSYEQAMILNSWSPEFEPDKAPDGYGTVCNFATIRGGKTFAAVMNTFLWIFPNDGDFPIFEPLEDHMGRKYQVKRRPIWSYYKKTGRMIYEPDEPPVQGVRIWHGCPDETHWKTKLDPEYRRWCPMKWIARKGKDIQWMVSDKWFETLWGTRVIGKLYQSDMQAWSGEEVFLTNLDEGPPEDKLDEVKYRTEFINWAYTSREHANIGDRVRVAKEVYDGKKQLVGQTRCFVYGMKDLPPQVMDEEKKKRRLAIAAKGDDLDRSAVEGGFVNSSPVVFSYFDRARNVLPVTGSQILDAINGKSDPVTEKNYPWLDKFRGANIIRGFDEGLAHPTACVWEAILKSGESVVFKEMEAVSNSIVERAEKIIALSGNLREEVKSNPQGMTEEDIEIAKDFAYEIYRDKQRERDTGQTNKRYREKFDGMIIRKTFADSKIFKRDPQYPLDDWTVNYSRAGLKMERATNALPESRCDFANGLFKPDHTRKHLNPLQIESDDWGCGMYVTYDCVILIERLENYLWDQIKSGPRMGDFTGKPQKTGDDIIDAFCYAANARLRWTDMREFMARRKAA